MAFSTYEVHPYAGYPVELFDFYLEGLHHRYANHDIDVTVGGHLWLAQTISRGSFSKGSELVRSSIEVNTVLDLPVIDNFNGGMPDGQVDLTIYRVHLTDPAKEAVMLWTGQVTSIKRSDRNLILKCEVPEVHLKSVGLRRRIQKTCPHPLYGTGCFLDKENFKQVATVVAVEAEGRQLKMSLADCSAFTGGLFSAYLDSHWKHRFISRGAGAYLSVSYPADWATVGVALNLYPGCNKSTDHCMNRFNNILNFGGFPHLTSSNLFSTRIY